MPRTISRRWRGPWPVALALVLAYPAWAQRIDQSLWGTDGAVNSVIRLGSTLYVGGVFTHAGPNMGGGVVVSRSTGEPSGMIPRITGAVNAATPDGSGGWYVGGAFVAVDGERRMNLAHVLADGAIAPWNPETNGEVLALAVDGATVYVGGSFTAVGGQSRMYLAAIDAGSGVVADWNPAPDLPVRCLLVNHDRIFVGGDFGFIGGKARGSLAELGAAGLVADWDPDVFGSVHAMATIDDSLLLIGGDFGSVGGLVRSHLATIRIDTGIATTWAPVVTGPRDRYFGDPYVQALAVRQGIVYVGGHFTGIGGQTRPGLAALELATGLSTSWDPHVVEVTSLVLADSTIYAGGFFRSAGGAPRLHVAEISLGSGLATAWNPGVNDAVRTLSLASGRLFVGGTFTGLGALWQSRTGLAAFDVTTGALRPWDPHPDGLGVWTVAAHGGLIYVGGAFDFIGGQWRSALASVDTVGGAATAWDPEANGLVAALAVLGDTVYVGGSFTSVAGQPRDRLAAFDLQTGSLASWGPSANTDVSGLVASGTTVYVAGVFSVIGGLPRKYGLAAVDARTGTVRDWDPQCDNWVEAIAVVGDTVFVGGSFTAIGGRPRANLAALDAITASALPWQVDANSDVVALTVLNDTLYAGGSFSQIGGVSRSSLAAIDPSSGTVLPWAPELSISEWLGWGSYPVVRSLFAADHNLYLGGAFGRIGSALASNLASISFGPPPFAPPPVPPQSLALATPFPNPVRTDASLRFALPAAGPVDLAVFDLQGRCISSLLRGTAYPAGIHDLLLKTTGWPVGFYYLRLEFEGHTATRRFVVLQ